MFNPLKGLGDLKSMRDQAVKMQKALAQEEIVVEEDGIRVVMSGDQKMKEITIDGQPEERVVRAVQEAIKKTQQIAAQQLTKMSGSLSQ